MVAEKIVTTLHDVFSKIIEYIQTLDTSNNPELREIELEYICAFANDTALHIEDMMELIETFTIGKDVCIVDFNIILLIIIHHYHYYHYHLLILNSIFFCDHHSWDTRQDRWDIRSFDLTPSELRTDMFEEIG